MEKNKNIQKLQPLELISPPLPYKLQLLELIKSPQKKTNNKENKSTYKLQLLGAFINLFENENWKKGHNFPLQKGEKMNSARDSA